MAAAIFITTFVIIVLGIIFFEYRNEKRYQKAYKKTKEHTPPSSPKRVETKKNAIASDTQDPSLERKEQTILPPVDYGTFDHSRLIGMGLSEEEAVTFVKELIAQTKAEIPRIKEAIEAEDFIQMERLTHTLKGSATNIGSGGIADLLVQYNTYLKTGEEVAVAKAYLNHLQDSLEKLSRQYA